MKIDRKNSRRTQEGFTLIELLVVTMLTIIVGSLIASILVSALRSANKSNTMTDVRQNGSFIIGQTNKILRYAKEFNGVSTDDVTYVTDCTGPSQPYNYIKVTAIDGGQTTLSCSATTIASNSASLINTNAVTVSSCSFTCNQTVKGSLVTIDLNFALTSNTTSLFAEKKTYPIPFSTSVTIRNASSL